MERRQALAGFALSGSLFVLALPAPSPEPRLCRDPIESAAVERHTVAVRCQGSQARAGEIRGPARRLFGLPIELNCAGARTLETLKGIGSVRARRIVTGERIRRSACGRTATTVIVVSGITNPVYPSSDTANCPLAPAEPGDCHRKARGVPSHRRSDQPMLQNRASGCSCLVRFPRQTRARAPTLA